LIYHKHFSYSSTTKETILARDDFSVKTKQLLAEKVSNLCSNPSCRVLTLGAKYKKEASTKVGVAAHIHAAAKGGPRYCPSQLPDERKAYENGIWLCQTCSRLIDVDEEKYSASMLRSWKQQAEAHSNNSIGKPLHDEAEVEKRVLRRLLENRAINQGRMPGNLVHEAIQFQQDELTKLDPRFEVHTNVLGGTITHLFQPKLEDVPISLSPIDKDIAIKLNSDFNALKEEAKPFKLKTNLIVLSGSPLIETMFQDAREVEILPIPKKIKLELHAYNTSYSAMLKHFSAKMTNGTRKSLISGEIFVNLLRFNAEVSDMNQVTFNFSPKAWRNQALKELRFFKKLEQLRDILSAKGYLKLNIVSDEEDDVTLLDTSRTPAFDEFKMHINVIVTYVGYARKISDFTNSNIVFGELDINNDEFQAMEEIANLIDGQVITTSESIKSDGSFEMTIDENADIQGLLGKPTTIRFSKPSNLTQLFGQPLPPVYLNHVFSDVLVLSDDELVPGNTVTCRIRMIEKSKYIRSVSLKHTH